MGFDVSKNVFGNAGGFVAIGGSTAKPFVPKILFNQFYWEADSEAYADSASIPTMTDMSVGAHNATQATPGSQPVFKTGTLNGKPVARFDGVDDGMSLAIGNLGSVPFSVAFVAKGVGVVMGAAQAYNWLHAASDFAWYYTSGTTRNSIPVVDPLTNFTLFVIVFDGTTIKVYHNGTQISSIAEASQAFLNAIGRYAGGLPLNGDIALLAYGLGALSSGQRTGFTEYARSKYALF